MAAERGDREKGGKRGVLGGAAKGEKEYPPRSCDANMIRLVSSSMSLIDGILSCGQVRNISPVL